MYGCKSDVLFLLLVLLIGKLKGGKNFFMVNKQNLCEVKRELVKPQASSAVLTASDLCSVLCVGSPVLHVYHG